MTKIFQLLFCDGNGNRYSLIGLQCEKTGWWDYQLHSGWLPSGSLCMVDNLFKELPLVGTPEAVIKAVKDLGPYHKLVALTDAIAAAGV